MNTAKLHSRVVAAVTLAAYMAALLPTSLARADEVAPVPAPSASGSLQQGQAALGSADTSLVATNALATARVQPSTGFLETSIPFRLPAARGAIQPSLALVFNSTANIGVGGFGWSLRTSMPAIERHNPSGAPLFNDPPAGQPVSAIMQDHFTYGGEPLVLVCDMAGGACIYNEIEQLPAGETFPSFTSTGGWTYYRLATETGALLRFFWSSDHTQWIVQSPTGATAVYGAPSTGSTDLSGTDQDALS